MQTPDQNKTGWADRPEIRQRIRYALFTICGLLVMADLIVQRYTYLPVEEIPAFYAFYGFAALVGVVLLSKALRQVVGRKEDYYRQGDDDHVA
ncbi:MAG: hypothetical protein WD396_06495 [Pseudohongiellaceae bacterium]